MLTFGIGEKKSQQRVALDALVDEDDDNTVYLAAEAVYKVSDYIPSQVPENYIADEITVKVEYALINFR